MSGITTANSLPSNVLEVLSGYVAPREHRMMEDACLRLHIVSQRVAEHRRQMAAYSAYQPRAPQSPAFEPRGPQSPAFEPRGPQSPTFQRLPSFQRLALSDMPLNSVRNILSFLQPSERALPVIELESSRSFYQKHVRENTLDLEDTNIDDAAFIKLMQEMGDKYTYINLSGCSKLTKKSFEILAKFNKLKSLNLSRCTFTDSDIQPLLLACKTRTKLSPGLRALNLSNCPNITGRDFDKFNYLKRLDLTACTGLIPQAYENLSHAGALETLILSKTRTTDALVEMLRGKSRLNLRTLDLRKCNQITDKVIKRFSREIEDGFTLKMDDKFIIPKQKKKHSTDARHDIQYPLMPATTVAAYHTQIKDWARSVTFKRVSELWKIPDTSYVYAITGEKSYVDPLTGKKPLTKPKLKEKTIDDHSSAVSLHLEQIQLLLNGMTPASIKKLPLPASLPESEHEAVRKDIYFEARAAQKSVYDAVLKAWKAREFTSTKPLPTLTFPLLDGATLSF